MRPEDERWLYGIIGIVLIGLSIWFSILVISELAKPVSDFFFPS